jgi:alpha/beta superfamily hydrolase
MYVAKICKACIIDLLGVVGVLHVMYLVSVKATTIILTTEIHPTHAGKGNNNICYMILPSSLPALVG